MAKRNGADQRVRRIVERVILRIMEDNGVEDRPTVPAVKSVEWQAAEEELAGKVTHNPKKPPSQKATKVNAIRKELRASGFENTPETAQTVTRELPGWYDALDPSEALVSTAKDLADRFAQEHAPKKAAGSREDAPGTRGTTSTASVAPVVRGAP